MAVSIQIENVTRRFGRVTAVDDVSLEIRAGEFFTLLGSSGCGKSSLLNLIGGFDRPDLGRICFDGQDAKALPPNKRPVNMVFQNLALFPHMNVARNVGYGLRLRGLSGEALVRRVEEALELVQLPDFGPRDVNVLSGGQRQRVALARALVMKPGILLLDEPLTGLDERLRQSMRDEFGRLHQQTGATFVLVTHNQDEAVSLSSRMAIMHRGRIEQAGVPAQFFEQPANSFVARFIGLESLVRPSRVTPGGETAEAEVAGQKIVVQIVNGARAGDSVVVFRPNGTFVGTPETPGALTLAFVGFEYRGLYSNLRLAFADGQEVVVAAPADQDLAALQVGQPIHIGLKKDAALLIPDTALPAGS